MNQANKPFPAFLIIVVLFSACRELAQDEFPDFDPVPVMNGILVAGETVKVNLSLAGKLDSNKLEFIEDAEVSLYVDDKFTEYLEYLEEGNYVGNSVVREGKQYKCIAKFTKFDSISGITEIPVASEILQANMNEKAGRDEEGFFFPSLKFTFNNHPDQKGYFEAYIRLFDHGYENTGYPLDHIDPVLFFPGIWPNPHFGL